MNAVRYSSKIISRTKERKLFFKMLMSNMGSTRNQVTLWKTSTWRRVVVPIGIGVSLAALQWQYIKTHSYPAEGILQEYFHNFTVKCYYCLPLRITSRIWGWIASKEVPVSLRPSIYGFYAKTFQANLDEIDADLSTFPSLVDFFVRTLKEDVRPIDKDANMVSPSDGKILHYGPVTSCRVEQVKGVTYNLRHFLGDPSFDKSKKYTEEEDKEYIKSLLKNPENQLYQLTVYLAPGDYHRFHSPTNWEIEYRRHLQGKLFSVNPRIASFLPDLFSLNERAVYIGRWAEGFMAYAAVGATNVGSIKIYCDQNLVTNTVMLSNIRRCKEENLSCTRMSKGQLFGEFRMGSTIVLLFEASNNFQFCVNVGQSVKVGQPLFK